MKLMRVFIFVFLASFLNFSVYASERYFLEQSDGYVPEFSVFLDHLEQSYDVGKLQLPSDNQAIQVQLKVSNQRKEEKLWWHLYFFHPDRPGTKDAHFAIVHFHIVENVASFKGMIIDEKYRSQRLSKTLFKYFVVFTGFHKKTIDSVKIYKPLFGKLLHDFKMFPASTKFLVSICKPKENDSTVYIYPHGFKFRAPLMKSQKMKEVEEEPEVDSCARVAVYTSYYVSEDDASFWNSIDDIPGEYVIYVPRVEL